ncbi:hypothetical protein [Shewanella donghaensis]|uniref:hypothetical protein n=1 Tax=Shewanella donghaensis TaxID=238836 RepID=UPI0011826098|nr:hypothetical protein [Shewanella donghaensis]
MKYITHNWKSRSVIILTISLVISALLWTISMSEWAMGFNALTSEPHKEPSISPIIIGIVSLVKVTVMTLVPALLCYGVARIIELINRFFKVRNHNQNMKSKIILTK